MILAVLGAMLVVALTLEIFLLGYWLPLIPAGVGFISSAAWVASYMSYLEKKDRERMRWLFGRLVSEDVADEVWRQREELVRGGRIKGQVLRATVLYTDIKGYSDISEKLKPQELMDWLNEYMTAMGAPVLQRGGMINKYIGDAIMAVFGAPVPRRLRKERSDDAISAVACALDMRNSLAEWNETWQKRGLHVRMRIGIFTGSMVAGSLGSAQRLEYTVIGDVVNIASRLESYEKDLVLGEGAVADCRILVGDKTKRLLGNRFDCVYVDDVHLKGIGRPIKAFSIMGPGMAHANPQAPAESPQETTGKTSAMEARA